MWMNCWNDSFNQQRLHCSGKDIYVHDSNGLGENKSENNETSNKTMKHKS